MINKIIASVLPWMPKKIVWLFSKRYIAGETLDSAVAVASRLAKNGVSSTIDHLGEYITDIGEARMVRDIYKDMIERFEREKLSVTYSLKPSNFGMLIDFEVCCQFVREVVAKAKEYNSFVRIDMEDSRCVDDELELYRRLHAEFPQNVGIVIQAYLKRTPNDLLFLEKLHSSSTPVNVRLCKGIYVEPPEIAYKERKVINEQYIKALEFFLQKGIYVGIATHDRALTDYAQTLIKSLAVKPDRYEFQMLYGVTPDLRAQIVKAGHPMRVYVPYGKEWFGYSSRRLKENPHLITYILKALFKRG
ncbi:proline dehydrogenase family protein [Thermophagus xiamenensis]|uniref:proline dehydrogenase n=1 Tax=Thermophagus xiamenensis TaxID=385682 RepID=A0A1I1YXD5_9BACT|nr:proline dehydrogenase family protein [Thermophagus xiamenensis]SFE24129.1 L-proline dehydrogenase [Thermophagus xiamenensis]